MTEDGLRARIDALLARWRDGSLSKVTAENRIAATCALAGRGVTERVARSHPSPAVRILLAARCRPGRAAE